MNVYPKTIYASQFAGRFKDDTELFRYMFSKISNGTKIILEPRTYYVNSLKDVHTVNYDDAFIIVNNKKRITIVGNGATIIDSASKERISNKLFNFFKFVECSRVSINEVIYQWLYESQLDPKVEGIIFIRTIDECSNFDINVSVYNAGRGLYAGEFECGHNIGKGLCNSRITVHTVKVGYPIAIERGDKLLINNYFDICHRGTYLAGVTNSVLYVEGKEAYSTRVNLLLTDHANTSGCYHCDNIEATVIDTGTNKYSNLV